MNTKEYKIKLSHFPSRVDILTALVGEAGQENCDGEEYDLIQEAGTYIRFLREENEKLKGLLTDALNTFNEIRYFEPCSNDPTIQDRIEAALSDYKPEAEHKPSTAINEALRADCDGGHTKAITSTGGTVYSSNASSEFFKDWLGRVRSVHHAAEPEKNGANQEGKK